MGNTLADEVAEAAAKRVQPDMNSLKSVKGCEYMGCTVAERIAIIQAEVWAREAELGAIYELDFLAEVDNTPQSAVTAKLVGDMAQSGHNLVRVGKGFQCLNCKTVRALKHVGYWNKNRCRPSPPSV